VDHLGDDEIAYKHYLDQARALALSDSAIVTKADIEKFCHEILLLESGCACGIVTGADLCNNQVSCVFCFFAIFVPDPKEEETYHLSFRFFLTTAMPIFLLYRMS